MIDPHNRGFISLDNMVLREWSQIGNYLSAMLMYVNWLEKCILNLSLGYSQTDG
jgi:hypothetical protein